DPRAAESQLEESGLDPAGSVLAAARGTESSGAELHRRLARARVPHLLLHRDRMLYVVLADDAVEPSLLANLGELVGALGTSDRVAAADRVPDAAQEARWALSAAEADSRRVVRYGDETAMLPPRTPAEARVLVSRILGPLISHDSVHGTDYVNTPRAILRPRRPGEPAG